MVASEIVGRTTINAGPLVTLEGGAAKFLPLPIGNTPPRFVTVTLSGVPVPPRHEDVSARIGLNDALGDVQNGDGHCGTWTVSTFEISD